MSLTTRPLQASYPTLRVCGSKNMHMYGLHTHTLPRGALMVTGFNFGGVEVEDISVTAPETCGAVR